MTGHSLDRSLSRPREGQEYRNRLLVQFFGLRRGGNHGVIAWIAQQYPSPIVFLNNVKSSPDPFRVKAIPFPNAIPERRLSPAEADELRARQKELLLVSFESAKLRQVASDEGSLLGASVIGRSERTKKMLLLRDFYNWIASNVRVFEDQRGGFSEKQCESHIKLWVSYAREFCGQTASLGTSDVVKISYNRWLNDEAYRAEILASAGIAVVNNSRSVVPANGGGSSFNGTSYSGNAESMDVLSRWRYLDNARYQPFLELFKTYRTNIDRYNKRLFGFGSPFAP